MTGTQGQNPNSNFNQRADNAALKLKSELSDQFGVNIPERKVEVGPDGQPPKPPPPEGSYARQAYDQHRQQQQAQSVAQMDQPTQAEQLGQQPMAGTQEQAMDGSMAPPLQQTAQPPQAPEGQELSPNAQSRFAKLTQDLRDKDRKLQELEERARSGEQTASETQAALQALQQQHQQMLQANLENLDPETRMQVLQDARMREYMDNLENRIMSKIQPQISGIQENRTHDEMRGLTDKYPAFDYDVHGPLIEMFRGKNQHCSVEQAFRAIAEPEELVQRGSVPATAVPPVVSPRASMQNPQSRYIPEPESNPEQEMRDEAAQIGKLRRSLDAADQKMGMNMIHKNLADRLGHRLPSR